MQPFISYSIKNDKEFQETIKRAISIVDDLRVPFRSIAADFRKSRRAIFKLKSAGQYPDFQGKKIGELRKSSMQHARANAKAIPESANNMTPYQYRKTRKYGGTGYPLLKASGRLEKSLVEKGGENITIIDKRILVVGSSVPYGKYHQSDSPRKKIPLRKYLFIGPEAGNVDDTRGTLDRWSKIIESWLLKRFGVYFRTSGGDNQGGDDV